MPVPAPVPASAPGFFRTWTAPRFLVPLTALLLALSFSGPPTVAAHGGDGSGGGGGRGGGRGVKKQMLLLLGDAALDAAQVTGTARETIVRARARVETAERATQPRKHDGAREVVSMFAREQPTWARLVELRQERMRLNLAAEVALEAALREAHGVLTQAQRQLISDHVARSR